MSKVGHNKEDVVYVSRSNKRENLHKNHKIVLQENEKKSKAKEVKGFVLCERILLKGVLFLKEADEGEVSEI